MARENSQMICFCLEIDRFSNYNIWMSMNNLPVQANPKVVKNIILAPKEVSNLCDENHIFREGPWDQREKDLFQRAYQRGIKDPLSLTEIIKSRTITQVRSHLQKFKEKEMRRSEKSSLKNMDISQLEGDQSRRMTRSELTKVRKAQRQPQQQIHHEQSLFRTIMRNEGIEESRQRSRDQTSQQNLSELGSEKATQLQKVPKVKRKSFEGFL